MAENFIVTISTTKDAAGSHHQQAMVINVHTYTDFKHECTNSSADELRCTALATEIHPQRKAITKHHTMSKKLIMASQNYKSA
jgi:hypothetical protein